MLHEGWWPSFAGQAAVTHVRNGVTFPVPKPLGRTVKDGPYLLQVTAKRVDRCGDMLMV